jgi:hypothetical protein
MLDGHGVDRRDRESSKLALSEASGEAESKRIIYGEGPMNNPG